MRVLQRIDRFIVALQDSATYRLWEVAGTAHFDQYGLVTGRNDVGERGSVAEWFDFMLHPTNQPSANFRCPQPINATAGDGVDWSG